MPSQIEHRHVRTNSVRLHVVQSGPESGPPAILLHGFPEYWYGWRDQIPDLAGAGYRVWAPDQRGYNLSDKPADIAAYKLDELAKDVVGLLDAAGGERAFLVGHDWGAAVAWWVAGKYPGRLKRLIILNVPHPTVLYKNLRRNPGQILKSWYIFFFQLPWLPEMIGRLGNWWPAAQTLTRTSRPGTFTPADLERYRQAWSQPGAVTAMVNWYRALLRQRPEPPTTPRITVPTLLIWGVQDRALGREMAQPSIDLCDDGRLVFFEEATHWVQHEEPERVNELMIDFLRDADEE